MENQQFFFFLKKKHLLIYCKDTKIDKTALNFIMASPTQLSWLLEFAKQVTSVLYIKMGRTCRAHQHVAGLQQLLNRKI